MEALNYDRRMPVGHGRLALGAGLLALWAGSVLGVIVYEELWPLDLFRNQWTVGLLMLPQLFAMVVIITATILFCGVLPPGRGWGARRMACLVIAGLHTLLLLAGGIAWMTGIQYVFAAPGAAAAPWRMLFVIAETCWALAMVLLLLLTLATFFFIQRVAESYGSRDIARFSLGMLGLCGLAEVIDIGFQFFQVLQQILPAVFASGSAFPAINQAAIYANYAVYGGLAIYWSVITVWAIRRRPTGG